MSKSISFQQVKEHFLSASRGYDLPHCNRRAAGDIQRMLGAILGDLKAEVGDIHYPLIHPLHFIPHHKRHLL